MVRFRMVGRDTNSSPVQYRTWIVNDTPDFTGELYTGLKSGDNALVDVTAYAVLDGYAVVDFNYPEALQWNTTYEILPEAVYNSQLAIIDGYAYLFGGQNDGYGTADSGYSSKIFRADLNNPAAWTNTYAELPIPLANSQLAIVDGYVYLFGGFDGYTNEPSSHIFSASLADPLTWTDQGSLLPDQLSHSQLAISDGYLYLYGGFNGKPVSSIFKAEISDPLTWFVDGYTLPDSTYRSHVGMVDGYIYLFGGLNSTGTPTSKIYKADIIAPTSFSFDGYLPYATFDGQFFTIGRQGCLIAPADTDVSFTKIFQCSLDTPNMWVDSGATVPGSVAQSQLAIIYDRLFLFGGNGSSVIFASEQSLKYSFTLQKIIDYGDITRTQYNDIFDSSGLFSLLGFPYWKTNYGS